MPRRNTIDGLTPHDLNGSVLITAIAVIAIADASRCHGVTCFGGVFRLFLAGSFRTAFFFRNIPAPPCFQKKKSKRTPFQDIQRDDIMPDLP
jgi:hypothetical protein